VRLGLADHSATAADGAWALDCLSFAVALIAVGLYLLEEPRCELLSLNAYSASAACTAGFYVSVF
jgi:hypothetical protein